MSSDQQCDMLGNALARHLEVPTKLIQRLTIIFVKLIEQGAAASVGKSFED